MSEERKPLWPWIVALSVGLPTLYILSGAPAELLMMKMGEPEWLLAPGQVFYAPLAWLLANCPDAVNDCYAAYGDLWIAILGEP